MSRFLLLSFLLCLSLSIGCSSDDDGNVGPTGVRTIAGNGVVTQSDVDIAGVDEIAFAIPGELRISQGEDESCSLWIEENLLPYLDSTTWDDELRLEVREDVQLAPTEPIVCEIVLRDLESVVLAGSSDLELSDLTTGRLVLTIAGSGNVRATGLELGEIYTTIAGAGNVELSGSADRQALTIAGSGNYMARHLATRQADITISGSGSATVNATYRLAVLIAGYGSVYYLGDPVEVHATFQGTGRVVRIE